METMDKKEEFNNKLKKVEEDFRKMLDEAGLEITYDIEFPQYKILPNKIKLALAVIMEEGGKVAKIYTDKKNDVLSNKEEPNAN